MQVLATDRSRKLKTIIIRITKYAIRHRTTAKGNPLTTRLALDWELDSRIAIFNPACTRYNMMESEEVTTAATIQILVMGVSTSKKLTLAIVISHGIKGVLAHKAIITIRLPRETVWLLQTIAVKILRRHEGVCSYWKNVCRLETNRWTKPSTRITRDNSQKALETVKATVKQTTINSLLTFQSHPELQTKEPNSMLRPIENNLTRVGTKTIEKFSNQTPARVKITTKEIQLKTLTMFCLVERLVRKEDSQVCLSLTIRTKASSTNQKGMKNQCGKFPKKISPTRLIWMFIKQKTTENNNQLLLHLRVANITTKLIIRLDRIMAHKELPIVPPLTRTSHTNHQYPRTKRQGNSSNSYPEASRSPQFKWWASTQLKASETLRRLRMPDLALEMPINLMSTEK